MGGDQASQTLLSLRIQQMERGGRKISKEEQQKLLEEITRQYDTEMDPMYAASQLWIDGIIDPREIRDTISLGIEVANNNPSIEHLNVGVLQT